SISRRRSLLARLAAAFAARRSLATGMFRLRRSFGKPPASGVLSPAPADRSGRPALGVASVFVMEAVPLSRLGEGWGARPPRSVPGRATTILGDGRVLLSLPDRPDVSTGFRVRAGSVRNSLMNLAEH